MTWTPDSWQRHPAEQQPEYPDRAALAQAVQRLSRLPPLVTPWEVRRLEQKLALAQRGAAFVLQGGDCAESFADCEPVAISSKLKILLQMSLVLIHASHAPVIRIGRIAGQYAKPRSQATETRDGVTLPSYRGDLVNAPGFTVAERTPDPELLLRGYERAALTLNHLRSLADGGFADLNHPENWNLEFAHGSPSQGEYQRVVRSVREALFFLGAVAGHDSSLSRAEIFTSHEALVLAYEQAQTRRTQPGDAFYNLSTHMPWLGVRTASLDGAHVEYLRGIQNPVGVKVGPGSAPEDVVELARRLNPDARPGRLALIHRMGVAKVADKVPPLIDAVRASGMPVLWMCDPMHGNTEATADGTKTRRFENILRELESAFEVHANLGTHLGGVHFELTGEDVTECLGGARGLEAADLHRAYRSSVDPRLNYEQSLEMALLVAERLARARQGR
jgi:3-deoxy-7-phosphoheptulonate synthase